MLRFIGELIESLVVAVLQSNFVTKLILGILAFALISWLIFSVTRWFNYTFGYKSQVQHTVCTMVKKEHLTSTGKDICR